MKINPMNGKLEVEGKTHHKDHSCIEYYVINICEIRKYYVTEILIPDKKDLDL